MSALRPARSKVLALRPYQSAAVETLRSAFSTGARGLILSLRSGRMLPLCSTAMSDPDNPLPEPSVPPAQPGAAGHSNERGGQGTSHVKRTLTERTCRFCGFVGSPDLFFYNGVGKRMWLFGTCKKCKAEKKKIYGALLHVLKRKRLQRQSETSKKYHAAYQRKRVRFRRGTEEGRRQLADTRLRSLYGISLTEYERLVAAQGGKCAICRCDPSKVVNIKKLVVDHCHKTNTTRGLICARCNRGLGVFRDSPKALRQAANYLEKFSLFHGNA